MFFLVQSYFSSKEIDIASAMGMDTVSLERKPLKSSKDRMDLLFLLWWNIYFECNKRLSNSTVHFTLEEIDIFFLVRSHFSPRMR
jgi:hypothetical protein